MSNSTYTQATWEEYTWPGYKAKTTGKVKVKPNVNALVKCISYGRKLLLIEIGVK